MGGRHIAVYAHNPTGRGTVYCEGGYTAELHWSGQRCTITPRSLPVDVSLSLGGPGASRLGTYIVRVPDIDGPLQFRGRSTSFRMWDVDAPAVIEGWWMGHKFTESEPIDVRTTTAVHMP